MRISDNGKGLILAVASGFFIGSSFILKKKGLKLAAASGTRAGIGGYTYLLQPLWWAGMMTMFVGEVANFVAYIYAPAVLVTPLGALSIIVSAILAHFMLKERIQRLGVLGCVCCIVGSVVIVIHAPEEHTPDSVQEIWDLATQPGFVVYVVAALSIIVALIFHFEPRYGQTNILVYLGICSLTGSLTVVSVKAIGISIKLTLDGISQIAYPQTWFFPTVAVICVITQLNYLNKISTLQDQLRRCSARSWFWLFIVIHDYRDVDLYPHWSISTIENATFAWTMALDTFNAAIVSPIYYVMFTTLTIVASVIMFKDWSGQDVSSIASEICGFITVLSGTIILHATREQETSVPGSISWYGEDKIKTIDDSHFLTLDNSGHFEKLDSLP